MVGVSKKLQICGIGEQYKMIKMIKDIINTIKFWFSLYWPYLVVIASIILSIWLTYIIANSGLPFWMKWWLLR